MIKNTKELQLNSVVSFANAVGFYLENTEAMGKVFVDERGYRVGMQSMINYHNGSIPGIGCFSGMAAYARVLANKLRADITEIDLREAYNHRLVFFVKYVYSKKRREFTCANESDNIVTLMPGTTL